MKSSAAVGLLLAALFFGKNLAAQDVDPVFQLPPMDSLYIEGEAFLFGPNYEVVIGGRFCNKDPEIEACDFNQHILAVERRGRRVWAIPLFNLPAAAAQHLSAVGLCAATDEKGVAWVSGGYGFDGDLDGFSTMGSLTSFPLERAVSELLAGRRADSLFTTIHDPRLAVFDGRLMTAGKWFFLFGGSRAVPVFDEIYHVNLTSYEGQMRSWRLACGPNGSCQVAGFRVCERVPGFFQCMPEPYFPDEGPDIDLK